jgi:phosphoserine phosphatase
MDKKSENDERFTGLILLSGVDSPGIFSALFCALEPFSINVLDIEQVINRSRLILTVLIELDPAHAQAVEEDLNQCAETLNVDIAVSFASETIESFAQKNNLVHISASAQKLNPGAIANLALSIAETGGNVERIHRSASSPSTTIEFFVSGATSESLQSATNLSALNSGLNLVIQENI